ncbi:MAG: hypothetical protein MUC49_10900 [Raineya sp.]|nr:hypothetical protein [Raineya sp.]
MIFIIILYGCNKSVDSDFVGHYNAIHFEFQQNITDTLNCKPKFLILKEDLSYVVTFEDSTYSGCWDIDRDEGLLRMDIGNRNCKKDVYIYLTGTVGVRNNRFILKINNASHIFHQKFKEIFFIKDEERY